MVQILRHDLLYTNPLDHVGHVGLITAQSQVVNSVVDNHVVNHVVNSAHNIAYYYLHWTHHEPTMIENVMSLCQFRSTTWT
jgi:hypothetical protein